MRPITKHHAAERMDEGHAFLDDFGSGPARTKDALAESLAEEFLAAATSGEEMAFDDRDQTAAEEVGGPYLEVTIPEDVLALAKLLDEDLEKESAAARDTDTP